MKKLVIAVDCDDVLVATTPWFVDTYNKRYGTQATLAQARDADPLIWGAEEQEVIARWTALTDEDEYKRLKPDTNEVRVLKELAEHHELHLVTARKEVERAFTQDMLDKELRGVFQSMEFVGWEGSKGEVCRRLSADVLIDDNANHLHDAIACGLPKGGALLFGAYPWNANDVEHPELRHCHNWGDVKKAIDTLAIES